MMPYSYMKWNEWGFRPPLCTSRLNWVSRTSWWWWDEWDDTALQTQDSKFEPCRSEAEHATSRSRRLPTILIIYEWARKKHFVSLKLEGQSGVWTRDLRLSKQAALTTAAPGSLPSLLTDYFNPLSNNTYSVSDKSCPLTFKAPTYFFFQFETP